MKIEQGGRVSCLHPSKESKGVPVKMNLNLNHREEEC